MPDVFLKKMYKTPFPAQERKYLESTVSQCCVMTGFFFPVFWMPLSGMCGLCVLWFPVSQYNHCVSAYNSLVWPGEIAPIQPLQCSQLHLTWQEDYSDPLTTGVSFFPGQGRAVKCMTKHSFCPIKQCSVLCLFEI